MKNYISGIDVSKEDDDYVYVTSGSGVIWDDLVTYCITRGYGGIENLTAIPGTVGAAPIQNIGAYGAELKDVFFSLDGFYIDNAQKKTFYNSDCNFTYRSSIFKRKLKYKFIITSVTLKLNKKPKLNLQYDALKKELEKKNKNDLTIADVSRIVADIRSKKLPDPQKLGNAGSFFKNPVITKIQFEKLKEKYPDIISYPTDGSKLKIPAGWLIEKIGWKGSRFGNTGTYDKQALVIVNYNSASGEEIYQYSKMIQDDVYEKFKIKLIPEVNII
jgi:UDP-N-acetylmuramate dehydrogenase